MMKKLGTIDIFIVEANPVVFKGRPWLMQYIRYTNEKKRYRGNTLGTSYFRFLDMTDMKTTTPPFGHGLHMGNAFVEGDRIVVTAVENWGKSKFYQLESNDMVHWTEPRVILSGDGWQGYNTSVCKAGDRYILTFELGAPKEMVNVAFTMFFAESRDLREWKLIPDACFGRDFYTGAPVIRYHDGMFYFFYLNGNYKNGYEMYVAYSKDLKNWTISDKNPVMTFDESDKLIHPAAQFNQTELDYIRNAVDINASDLDFCDYNGKLICSYSWGNQRGDEFLALAEADTTEAEFCKSFL